jgi:hypothetical protein
MQKKNLIRLFAVIALLFVSMMINAQETLVKGTVISATDSQPIIGATVREKGTQNAAIILISMTSICNRGVIKKFHPKHSNIVAIHAKINALYHFLYLMNEIFYPVSNIFLYFAASKSKLHQR